MRAHVSTLASLISAVAVTGCGGPSTTYAGASIHEYLPLEGDREWEYWQCEPSSSSCTPDADFETLLVEKNPTTRSAGNSEVVTLEYSVLEPIELLHTIDWSSDSRTGIQIHGWSVGADGSESFRADSPITVSEYKANQDDVFESTTDGLTFTSTFLGETECTTHWVPNDPYKCVQFRIEGGNGDEPIVGDWYFSQSWGMVRHQPTDLNAPWVLACSEFDDDNC
ncbi:MAG: hypothetical protein VX265_03985 [Myxococcota bacterium]|nr:hypothetical protein [Myxococcota bacterium]